jgi:hypothetical protein
MDKRGYCDIKSPLKESNFQDKKRLKKSPVIEFVIDDLDGINFDDDDFFGNVSR